MMKLCPKCTQPLDESKFYSNRSTSSGLSAYCKECCKEEAKARGPRYYQENRERILADHKRAYVEKHAPGKRLSAKRWAEEHPQRRRELSRSKELTRRARKLDQFIEQVDPTVVFEMHGGRCGICGEFVSEDDFEVDHVIPLAKGGMHGYINVQPAHPICNLQKGTNVL